MGNRLSRIYTRTGDSGTTGLGDGTRVSKDSTRVEACGEIDELNSIIGLLLTEPLPEQQQRWLVEIQHDLFDLGGELSIPGHTLLNADLGEMERRLDEMNASLQPLAEFILPGGSRAAALCHLARTVCRRAERRLVTLHLAEQASPEGVSYLNRLSDLLFVMARFLNQTQGVSDVLWDRSREDPQN